MYVRPSLIPNCFVWKLRFRHLHRRVWPENGRISIYYVQQYLYDILVRVRFCFHKSKTLVVSLFQKKNTIYSRLVEYIHLQYNILYRRYKKIRSAKRNIIRGIFTVPSVREELYLPFRPVMKKYVYRPVDVPSWKTNTIVPYRPVPSGFFSPTVPSRPAPPIVMFFIFTVPSCPVFIFFLSNEL